MAEPRISLDTVLSGMFHFALAWTPELDHTKARDLLRYLICRLYDNGRGQLSLATLTLSQASIAGQIGLSRQWVNRLLSRLQDAGWLEYYSPAVAADMNGPTVFRIGRKLKRLIIQLTKAAKKRKSSMIPVVNSGLQSSPYEGIKRLLNTRKPTEAPPDPRVFERIPLLKQWLERGKQ